MHDGVPHDRAAVRCRAHRRCPAVARPGAGWRGFQGLATTNFDELARGVEAVGVSGHTNALPVVEALRGGRLLPRQAYYADISKYLPKKLLLNRVFAMCRHRSEWRP
jgi:hypothetical protein